MQKEIQLTDKTLLVVGFNTNNPIFIQSGLTNEDPIAFKLEYNLASTETIVIPDGEYELLGIYPELTEEQLYGIIPPIVPYVGKNLYPNYKDKFPLHRTKLESFQSLMEREKCYTVNPFGEEPFNNDMYYPASMKIMKKIRDEWEESQQRTFSKYAILIKSK